MRYKLSIPVTAILIALTILLITAFQAYWLSKNYREEEKLFTSRTNILFRETIFRLQAVKLKLDSNLSLRIQDRQGVMRMSNILTARLRDTTSADLMVTGPAIARTVPTGPVMVRSAMAVPAMRSSGLTAAGIPATATSVPTIPTTRVAAAGIPANALSTPRLGPSMVVALQEPPFEDNDTLNMPYARTTFPSVGVVNFLAGVDSLRDSITVKELTDRYRTALQRENINTAFTIRVTPFDTTQVFSTFPDDLENNIVTIGFTRPLNYEVLFQNNTWYLLRRISQPILVSVLLLGVTIFSFLLLYRNLKQQQKLAQLKNDFISNMTHELKTPIATVSVAIEALRSFDALEDRETTNEYLDISAQEIQRLGLLVDKVLKLSMFENREIALNKEQFDIRALARGVMASMKLQFEKQLTVTALQTTGNNFIITADKLHLTSVLYNLLDNALKYSTKNPDILVHIIDHKQFLEIRVVDHGIGIAQEYKTKIFEKFFRIPNGNRHNTKGYGLGLSYVSHIVQRHMGFIEVESELGKGSTFSVKLPFAEAPVVYYDKERRIVKFKN